MLNKRSQYDTRIARVSVRPYPWQSDTYCISAKSGAKHSKIKTHTDLPFWAGNDLSSYERAAKAFFRQCICAETIDSWLLGDAI